MFMTMSDHQVSLRRCSNGKSNRLAKVMAVNFWGVVHTTKAFLPTLTARPEACLVNVSSMGAFAPVPGQTIYGASKAAVTLLTEGLYAELRESGVAVTVVFPGSRRAAGPRAPAARRRTSR